MTSESIQEEAVVRQKFIDCDVHPELPSNIDSLFSYMEDGWRKSFQSAKVTINRSARKFTRGHHRLDAKPPSGGPDGSDPGHTLAHYIEPSGIDYAILNSVESTAFAVGGGSHTLESVALCKAYNDYFLKEWTDFDDRYRYAIIVPSRDPEASCEEIVRLGKERSVAAVNLAVLSIPAGSRYYHPIYSEADRLGLPIYFHPTALDSYAAWAPAPTTADCYTEEKANFALIGEAIVTDLILSGTLERFPNLKFVLAEYGFAWAVPLMWRLDALWSGLRAEVPWVKKLPSEYIREQFAFTTQPLPLPGHDSELDQLVAMLGYGSLMFSSDYPHWDNDMPSMTFRTLPEDARRKIYWENASKIFRV